MFNLVGFIWGEVSMLYFGSSDILDVEGVDDVVDFGLGCV